MRRIHAAALIGVSLCSMDMLGKEANARHHDPVAGEVIGFVVFFGQLVFVGRPIRRAVSRLEINLERTLSPSTTRISWRLEPPAGAQTFRNIIEANFGRSEDQSNSRR